MRRRNLVILLLMLVSGLVSAVANGADPATKRANPSTAPAPDDPKLPRVLIIGDSISMGYTPVLREMLQGTANVHRPADNCGETARGVERLDRWLQTDGGGKWAVIHFNFGLHDLKYLDAQGKYVDPSHGKQVASLETYEANLRLIVGRLKQTGAKLIWASTTPVPGGSSGRVKDDEQKYNTVAAKVMRENDIAIDDLWQIAHANQATLQRPKNVHFTDDGYRELAGSVARSIEKALKDK